MPVQSKMRVLHCVCVCLAAAKLCAFSPSGRSFSLPSQQAPDYRLYKSEPELTTVKEEVDEANGEDKDKAEASAESKDTAASKGTSRKVFTKCFLPKTRKNRKQSCHQAPSNHCVRWVD